MGHSTGALILTELVSTYASGGGSGDSKDGSGDSKDGSGDSKDGSGDSTGGSDDSTGGSDDSTGGSGDSTGGSDDSTGGSGDSTGGSDDSKKVSENAPVLIEKIVFLGAAATFDDFNKAIVPYLKENSDTNFYNISLNAYNEAKSSFWGVRTPSMLEWLDMFIARPADHLDRVMGKWENVMLAMHTIPCEVRGRVHLKHLPSGKGYPRHHRDLDDVSRKFNAFNENDWEVETLP